MQDEWLIWVNLNHSSHVWLILARIDELVLVVLEGPEKPIQPNVYRGWLHHFNAVRLEANPASSYFIFDVNVR
jgi:hypothetical protein